MVCIFSSKLLLFFAALRVFDINRKCHKEAQTRDHDTRNFFSSWWQLATNFSYHFISSSATIFIHHDRRRNVSKQFTPPKYCPLFSEAISAYSCGTNAFQIWEPSKLPLPKFHVSAAPNSETKCGTATTGAAPAISKPTEGTANIFCYYKKLELLFLNINHI